MAKAKEVKSVFLNHVKHNRAVAVVGMILGRPATSGFKAEYSSEGQQELVAKVQVRLKEEGIDPKKGEDAAITFVYTEMFAGGLRTQQAAKKDPARKSTTEDEDESEEGSGPSEVVDDDEVE